VVAIWRPLTFFLAANLDIHKALLKKIRDLNGPTAAGEIITKQLFKDHAGLNTEDLRDFGLWLTDQTKVSAKEVNHRLSDMKKRRMIRWHVYLSPPEVVAPHLSVHSLSVFSSCFFVTN